MRVGDFTPIHFVCFNHQELGSSRISIVLGSLSLLFSCLSRIASVCMRCATSKVNKSYDNPTPYPDPRSINFECLTLVAEGKTFLTHQFLRYTRQKGRHSIQRPNQRGRQSRIQWRTVIQNSRLVIKIIQQIWASKIRLLI